MMFADKLSRPFGSFEIVKRVLAKTWSARSTWLQCDLAHVNFSVQEDPVYLPKATVAFIDQLEGLGLAFVRNIESICQLQLPVCNNTSPSYLSSVVERFCWQQDYDRTDRVPHWLFTFSVTLGHHVWLPSSDNFLNVTTSVFLVFCSLSVLQSWSSRLTQKY